MKNQPEQKPKALRTIVAVAGLTLLAICAKDITNVAGNACAYVGKHLQPIRQVASSLVTDLTTQKPDTLYNATTNEVAILKGIIAKGPEFNKYAEKRASDFYFKNLSYISMRDLVGSPIKRDINYREAISFIKSTGKIE